MGSLPQKKIMYSSCSVFASAKTVEKENSLVQCYLSFVCKQSNFEINVLWITNHFLSNLCSTCPIFNVIWSKNPCNNSILNFVYIVVITFLGKKNFKCFQNFYIKTKFPKNIKWSSYQVDPL